MAPLRYAAKFEFEGRDQILPSGNFAIRNAAAKSNCPEAQKLSALVDVINQVTEKFVLIDP